MHMIEGKTGLGKTESVWTKRFIVAAIVQGAIIVALTAFLVPGSDIVDKTRSVKSNCRGWGWYMVHLWLYHIHCSGGHRCSSISFVSLLLRGRIKKTI